MNREDFSRLSPPDKQWVTYQEARKARQLAFACLMLSLFIGCNQCSSDMQLHKKLDDMKNNMPVKNNTTSDLRSGQSAFKTTASFQPV